MQNKIVYTLKGEEATKQLAALVAKYTVSGDLIRLDGTLGMGKTTFARAFVRALAKDDELVVPSPTFTLVQTYEETRLPLAHLDAYRMEDSTELEALDLEDYFSNGVTLIEWAENVEDALPRFTPPQRHIMETEIGDLLTITLAEGDDAESRTVTLSAKGTWLYRFGLIGDDVAREVTEEGRQTFLSEQGYEGVELKPTTVDCSFRRYFRGEFDGETKVLMDAPPPMEEVEWFKKTSDYFQSIGLRTPKIYAEDKEQGYLLLEDFGDTLFSTGFKNGADQKAWLKRAVDLLAHVANSDKQADVWAYDINTPWLEACRYTDWYLPTVSGEATSVSDRAIFKEYWARAFRTIMKVPQTTCHWDFHVDNLMMLNDSVGEGFENVGVIDFQDARRGPVTMDLACLLEDRFPAGGGLKAALIDRFIEKLDADVSKEDFMASYHLCVVHRFLKITGLLHRLEQRDEREGATARMPQVWQTLKTSLEHPACAQIKKFIEQHSIKEMEAA